jgi:hypothetical protein
MKWLVRLYPRAWRRQYEEEFSRLLEEYDASFIVILDVVLGAGDAHYQQWQMRRRLRPNALIIMIGVVLIALGLIFALAESTPIPVANSRSLHALMPTLALMIPVFSLIAMMLHLFLGITGIKLLKEVRDSL